MSSTWFCPLISQLMLALGSQHLVIFTILVAFFLAKHEHPGPVWLEQRRSKLKVLSTSTWTWGHAPGLLQLGKLKQSNLQVLLKI